MDVHYRLKMIPQAAGRRWEGSGNESLLQLLNLDVSSVSFARRYIYLNCQD